MVIPAYRNGSGCSKPAYTWAVSKPRAAGPLAATSRPTL